LEERISWALHATEIDPEFSMAWNVLGLLHAEKGDIEGAYATFERCNEAAPTSTVCIDSELMSRSFRGDCGPMMDLARAMRARAPDAAAGHLWVARALAARGAPEASILEEIHQVEALLPGAESRVLGPYLRARVAAHFGAHARAIELADQALSVAADTDAGEVDSTFVIAEALADLGQAERAKEVAREFVTARVGAMASVHSHPLRTHRELRLFELGWPSPEEEGYQRWRERWTAMVAERQGLDALDKWAHDAAAWARSEEEAVNALAAAPTELPQHGELTTIAHIGRVLLLAGRAEDAIPRLEHSAYGCMRLVLPFLTARSMVLLGRARLAAGDERGACEAWEELQSRWDGAGASQTLDESRDLTRRHCEQPGSLRAP
jgi:tetratricopeptide (TPR) repeat protein